MGRWWILTGAIALTALAALGWYLYGNAEGKIRATISAGAQAVERKEFGAAMRCVSPRYKDRSGLTFRDVQRMLFDFCRDKQSQLWLDVQVIQVQPVDFWQAFALVQVQGIVEAFGVPAKFGPMTVNVTLERTWWGRWRILSTDGWQDHPDIQKFQGKVLGE